MKHAYFGNLKFLSGTNRHGEKYEFWTCEILTPLAPEPLPISIKAAAQGPTDEHRIALEQLIQRFHSLQDVVHHVLFQQWTEILGSFNKHDDSSDGWAQIALGFRTPEQMPDLFELTSVSIDLDEECRFELYFSYNSKLSENDTTYVIVALSRDWNVSFGGGGD